MTDRRNLSAGIPGHHRALAGAARGERARARTRRSPSSARAAATPAASRTPRRSGALVRDGVDAVSRGAGRSLGRRRLLRPRPQGSGQDGHAARRLPRRRSTGSTRSSSASRRARRRPWIRSSACCSRPPWEALESAGIATDRLAGSATGVFVGITTSDYGQLLRAGRPRELRRLLGHRQRAQRRRRPPVLHLRLAGPLRRRSTPPARRRWWRCTWPARACAPARATSRSPAASTSCCRPTRWCCSPSGA